MFKEKRKAANLTQIDVVAELQKVEPRMNVPLYSNIEHGLVMPTSKQMKVLRQLMFDEKKRRESPYKLTVRVDRGKVKQLQEALAYMGYQGITDWVNDEIGKTIEHYEVVKEMNQEKGED